ncbi:MAG TPA: hypothetical protein VML19_35610 [Verrucomicrobiae bacterium]|nr:hypothetical protein [Verrucomicrobiae bacterium]
MKAAIWVFWGLMVAACIPLARAQHPYLNKQLASKQVVIHRALVLPAMVDFTKLTLTGAEGRYANAERISAAFYAALCRELAARGVEVLPDPMGAAKTDAEKFAVVELQTRYDTVSLQLQKHPGWVKEGRVTLDDRVARFAPGAGADALVFVRDHTVQKALGTGDSVSEVTFVDTKTGEVLAYVVFYPAVSASKDTHIASDLHNAMHNLPLPLPPQQ